jgi:hypothetical protein
VLTGGPQPNQRAQPRPWRPIQCHSASALDVSDAKRLKSLEDENAKLKKLLAEAMLDNAMLRDIAAKKW